MISHYDLLYKDGLYLDLHLPDMPAFDLFVYFHGEGTFGKVILEYLDTLAQT